MSNTQIASLSICGEITLNLHSLNNEGGEGNQIITRQLTVTDASGIQHTVNGISGDMFKHIHAFHLVNYALENKLDLCEGCKVFDPNRIGIDSKFLSVLKGIDSDEFEESDKTEYDKFQSVLNENEEGLKEYKDALAEIKKIEKKYIILKIHDEEDKKKYQETLDLLNLKLPKKGVADYEEKKKSQDDAKKVKKEIEKNYSLNFSNAEKIDKMLEICTVDDIHGILVTAEKNNLPRKSTIEFGWTVGIPGKNNTETYVHTKLVADAGEKGSGSGSNEGQNIFHRPANHGVYAFVCNVDVYRIGFNDIDRKYPKPEKRKAQYRALMQSLLNSFLNPRGAMTSTQKPHITDFKGVVSYSNKLIPAPTISPLNDKYREQIKTIADNLNTIEPNTITTTMFDSLSDLTGIFTQLINFEPYELGFKEKSNEQPNIAVQ
jgi:CRISPR-associated autoregulator DevR family